MIIFKRLVMPLALAVAMGSAAAPAVAQADPARAPVVTLSDNLITLMKAGKKLGFAGRAAQIAPVVDRVFDLPLMVRLCVGPGWTTTDSADKTALISAFRKLTISEYANNFDAWSGQSIAVDAKVETRGTDRFVKTIFSDPKAESVSLGYRLRQNGSDWRIIDVFFKNSISQLATRRSDFAAILAKGGVKSLVGHINQLAEKAGR